MTQTKFYFPDKLKILVVMIEMYDQYFTEHVTAFILCEYDSHLFASKKLEIYD